MGAIRVTRRRVLPGPGEAEEAAKAAAAAKAERAPHTLSEREAMLLPGAKLLDLGNNGHLRHLGIGVPPVSTAASKTAAGRPAQPPKLTDAQLTKMSGAAIRKAIAAGCVDGIGPRRQGRKH